MCSTCDYKTYEEINGRLEQNLGMGSLIIFCDKWGNDYKLAVKNEPRSAITLYRCPTCGRKLY